MHHDVQGDFPIDLTGIGARWKAPYIEVTCLMDHRHKRAIQERRKRERNQRIQSILDAASKVFFSKGYIKATVDEIALEAEISKPTVYQYFKTKDDLFFSLMLPVVEEIGHQLEAVEQRLQEGKYATGSRLVEDLFTALLHSYDMEPVTFRIIQLFQQSGFVGQLNDEIRSLLNEKGKNNFSLARRIVEIAIDKKLIKRVSVHEFVDVLWGCFVGVVQLEDIKSQDKPANTYLRSTLKLAERILAESMSTA